MPKPYYLRFIKFPVGITVNAVALLFVISIMPPAEIMIKTVKFVFSKFLRSLTIFYSPTSKLRGAIFLILSDNRHVIPKDKSISPIPAAVIKP